MWVAQDMANEKNLPEGWSMYLHADSGRHFYSKAGVGKSVWEHPNLAFYKNAVFMERTGWAAVKVRSNATPGDPPPAAEPLRRPPRATTRCLTKPSRRRNSAARILSLTR